MDSLDLAVSGSAWTQVGSETTAQLDELVFSTVSAALSSAGINRHQVGLSVISSLDLYDGRSISNALTAPAAAGYLNEEFRVEGDSMAAVISALCAIAAGEVDVAVVVGMHVPEIGSFEESAIRTFRELISNLTFDSHASRPVAMTAEATFGLHAATRATSDEVLAGLAASAARDISRGTRRRGVRAEVTAEVVQESRPTAAPLTELMMPAASSGVGALVLASGPTARRAPRPLCRVLGWGTATSPGVDSSAWLLDPTAATRAAAKAAYASSGVSPVSIELVELTDHSPALTEELVEALGLQHLGAESVNASGGPRANYPGIANGVLRIIEAIESLGTAGANLGVVHSMDDLSGLVTSTAGVLIVAAA